PRDGAPLVEAGEWSEGLLIRGRYRILSKVGQGGMGAVYKAHHEIFEELRALKVMNADLVSDEVFVKRFKQEAVIARKLDHPNAVRVHDIDEAEDGRPFIVMEYIEGASLKKVIQEEGRLTPARACSIAVQVAGALDSAHRIGMVHRDIKPANIVLVHDPNGERAKVLDFGVAKLKEARAAGRAGLTLTGTGMVVGTPQYMSPEQASGKRGDELDGRSDLYSLGVVMYQMLTGELPFKSDTTMGLLMAHINSPPRPMLQVRPDLNIPASLTRLVMKCLEKNPEKRPPNGAALIREIPFLQEMEWSVAPTKILPAGPRIPSRQVQTAASQARAMPPNAVSHDPSIAATAIRMPSRSEAVENLSSRSPGAAHVLGPRSAAAKRLIVGVIGAIVVLGAGFAVWRFDSHSGSRTLQLAPKPETSASGSTQRRDSAVSTYTMGRGSSVAEKQPAGGTAATKSSRAGGNLPPQSEKQVGQDRGMHSPLSGTQGLAASTHRNAAARRGGELQASIPEGSGRRPNDTPSSYVAEPADVDVVVLTAPGATVFMDRKRVGTADTEGKLEIHAATPGMHDLRLTLVGFPDLHDRINVPPADGSTSAIMVSTKQWGEPQNHPGSPTGSSNKSQSTAKPFQARFGVVHVRRLGLGSCKGVIVIGNDSLQFRAENSKDSFATPLDGVIWRKNNHGDLSLRLPDGKEYTFLTDEASAIIAAIYQALGQPNATK
ncbi:MAG TPA: serine/threonine-protein kinase, partial [Terriglobia bacterium]|nr:serine/threonine-protein kinase [Terriglobia bacterium]